MEELDDVCQLDILLLYEVVLDPVMEVMFPINSIRNMALVQVRVAGWSGFQEGWRGRHQQQVAASNG